MAKPVRKQSNSRFIGILVAVGVVGVSFLGYTLSRPRAGVKPVDPNLVAGTAEGYLVGNPDAPVKVLEFADYECPVCAQWAQVTEPDVKERLVKTGVISIRYFDFPLDIHPNSFPASNAVACGADQGKFEAMKDQVYALQDRWSDATGHKDPTDGLTTAAKNAGLDLDLFKTCYDSQKHYARIKANLLEGVRYGVGQTPTFVIGGTVVPGRIPYDQFKQFVDSAAAAVAAASKAGTKAAGKSGE